MESESEPCDNISKERPMEISVDPVMVMQNANSVLSPPLDENIENNQDDVVYLNGVDGENVTIKLIKKVEHGSHSDSEVKDPATKPFKCYTCERSFISELALKNHFWVHINKDGTIKKYNCSTCFAGFDFKCDLITHLRKHRTSGMCQLCGR